MDEIDFSKNKLREMQHEIRKNALDTQSYLSDLESWEKDIRQKDAALIANITPDSSEKHPVRQAPTLGLATPPPAKSSKKRCLKKKRKGAPIKSGDYRAWDNFDVDKACDDVDYAKESEDDERCGSECECDRLNKSDEEIEREARVKRAEFEKSKGNDFFEKGKYQEALKSYSLAVSFDSSNAVYFANRAMAALKLKRFSDAETDCTKALSLNPGYLKALHRRATARLSLKNLSGAKEDFTKVLALEPNNKDAKEKLNIIREWEEKYLPTAKGKENGVGLSERQTERKSVTPAGNSNGIERDGEGRSRVYPLPTPAMPVSSKPLRKVEIRESSNPHRPPNPVPSTPPASTETPPSVPPPKQTESAQTTSIGQVIPLLPVSRPSLGPPQSGRQFVEACAFLYQETNAALCADYLQNVRPDLYGKLIGQNLSREIFLTVVRGAEELVKRHEEAAALAHLTALADVPRFAFFVYSLTADQKSELRSSFTGLLAPGSPVSAEAAGRTAARFFLTL